MATVEHIFTLICTACAANVFIESGIPHAAKRVLWGADAWKRRLKPFDCVMCMGFWLGVGEFIFRILETETPFCLYVVVKAALSGSTTSVLAILIYKKLNK